MREGLIKKTKSFIESCEAAARLIMFSPFLISILTVVSIGVLLSFSGNNGIEEDRLDDLDDPTYEDVGPPIPVKKAIDRRKFSQEETKDFEALLDKVKILEVKGHPQSGLF